MSTLLDEAFQTSLGVASAKVHNQPADAALLIKGYLDDAAARDIPAVDAWATLFSASASWFTSLVECRAVHHNTSPAKVIQQLAVNLSGAIQ